MNDKEIVEKIAQGDTQGFRQFVDKYQSQIMNTCFGFVHNREDAEDITQNVFVEVYQSARDFRGDAKLSTWLYRIAVNKSLNHIRKNKKSRLMKSIEAFFGTEKNDALEVQDDYKKEPAEILENKERAKVLHQAINSLSENQRVAFTLNKYEDLSYKQIADVMETSLSSVESLIYRAKTNLQKKLIDFYKKK